MSGADAAFALVWKLEKERINLMYRGRVGKELMGELKSRLREALEQDATQSGAAGAEEGSYNEGTAVIQPPEPEVSWHWTWSGEAS